MELVPAAETEESHEQAGFSAHTTVMARVVWPWRRRRRGCCLVHIVTEQREDDDICFDEKDRIHKCGLKVIDEHLIADSTDADFHVRFVVHLSHPSPSER
jgi:hypothetical protein